MIKEDKGRENNCDLLRIISMILVISMHSAIYYKSQYLEVYKGNTEFLLITNFFDSISRFAVPCFMMISGSFLLADKKNIDYTFFYSKMMKNVVSHTLIFGAIYFFYVLMRGVLFYQFVSNDINQIIKPFKNVWVGAPFYHLWYMTVLIGIYLLIPWLIRFKEVIGEKAFIYVTIILLVVSVFSDITSVHTLSWDPGKIILYIPYFNLGYIIKRRFEKKEVKSFFLFSILYIGSVMLLTNLSSEMVKNNLQVEKMDINIFSNLNPIVVIGSISLFSIFANINISFRFGRLAEKCFYIYLIHAGVLDILLIVKDKLNLKVQSIFIDLLAVIVITFIISYIATLLYQSLYNKITNK